jgi:hypothetical protein
VGPGGDHALVVTLVAAVGWCLNHLELPESSTRFMLLKHIKITRLNIFGSIPFSSNRSCLWEPSRLQHLDEILSLGRCKLMQMQSCSQSFKCQGPSEKRHSMHVLFAGNSSKSKISYSFCIILFPKQWQNTRGWIGFPWILWSGCFSPNLPTSFPVCWLPIWLKKISWLPLAIWSIWA